VLLFETQRKRKELHQLLSKTNEKGSADGASMMAQNVYTAQVHTNRRRGQEQTPGSMACIDQPARLEIKKKQENKIKAKTIKERRRRRT
jgi:hypothetical protein